MKAVNKGFTLIELMIVVAVIGVLAAIAIPQYQNYVAKAELGSALSTVSAMKTNVEDYIATHGAFPNGTADDQKPEDLGGPTPENGTLGFTGTKINFAFNKAGKASEKVSGATLSLVRDATTQAWKCEVTKSSGSGSGVTNAILPKGCTFATSA
ncbi:pilin [Plesiomonas shigelloides]|uniref:pilin n=1 Tax=Plesiomonas shigelloides TaxID=703 RepID=UPI0031387FB3